MQPHQIPLPGGSLSKWPSHLGIPVGGTQPALQTEAYKELVNKLSWALGSTYGVPYTNMMTVARRWAVALATHTTTIHGYPATIGLPK